MSDPSFSQYQQPLPRGWQIDRRVPVATIISFIVVLLGQFSVATWYVSQQSARLEQVERRVKSLEDSRHDADILTVTHWDEIVARLTRIETQLDMVSRRPDSDPSVRHGTP